MINVKNRFFKIVWFVNNKFFFMCWRGVFIILYIKNVKFLYMLFEFFINFVNEERIKIEFLDFNCSDCNW